MGAEGNKRIPEGVRDLLAGAYGPGPNTGGGGFSVPETGWEDDMLTPTGYPPPTQQPTRPTAHTAHSQHCGHTALPPG